MEVEKKDVTYIVKVSRISVVTVSTTIVGTMTEVVRVEKMLVVSLSISMLTVGTSSIETDVTCE